MSNNEKEKIAESIENDLIFLEIDSILSKISDQSVNHILKAREVLWDTKKRLNDITNDRVEIHSAKDYRTMSNIEQTLIYMIDREKCDGDEYTAEVLRDLKDKYW